MTLRLDPTRVATNLGSGRQTKPLLRMLAGEATRKVPIWFMRQAGRYLPEYRAARAKAGGFMEACLDPALASEITLQPIRRFNLDAAIIFADILIIPHALGQRVAFREGEGPVLDALANPDALPEPKAAEFGARCGPVWETVRRSRALLPESTVLIGFAGSPWTVASYMVEGGSSRDFAKVKRWAIGKPVAFGRLIDRLIDATVTYLVGQIDAGAEVIQLFDSWAGALPAPWFDAWCIEPNRRIVAAVKAARPGFPLIGFPRGAGLGLEDFAAKTGVDVVSLDSAVPVAWAARTLQPRFAVQGNLDPVMLLIGGAAMKDEARRILGALGKGRFIFNLGHGIMPETPPEHVAELVATVRSATE